MTSTFRLLSLHSWSLPDDDAALDWLGALGGQQIPLPRSPHPGSVSAEVAAGLALGRRLALRPQPLPGPTHLQLLNANLHALAAVSAALPGLVVERSTVVVDLSEAGRALVATPFGLEVATRFLIDVETCGAEGVWFLAGADAACRELQAIGMPVAMRPTAAIGLDAAGWRAFLEGLTEIVPLRTEVVG